MSWPLSGLPQLCPALYVGLGLILFLRMGTETALVFSGVHPYTAASLRMTGLQSVGANVHHVSTPKQPLWPEESQHAEEDERAEVPP